MICMIETQLYSYRKHIKLLQTNNRVSYHNFDLLGVKTKKLRKTNVEHLHHSFERSTQFV